MKRLILAGAAWLCLTVASAQNVQLHYDLGHSLYERLSSRPNVTTTIEMFKPDQWGSTFLFADIDYFSEGVSGVYWEISREVNVLSGLALHVEYNGGLSSVERLAVCNRFRHVMLAGGAWNWHNNSFSRTFSLQLLYKRYFKGESLDAANSMQTTAVWDMYFCNKLLSFSGFVDVWYENSVSGKLVVLSEPQFWVNLNALPSLKAVNLSVGTEVEISNNLVYDNKGRNNRFYAIPTLALKWTF